MVEQQRMERAAFRGYGKAEEATKFVVEGEFPRTTLPWVMTRPGVPYFQTDDGSPWHPIGQNDAISWAELNPLFRRRDVAAVEAYLAMLASHGVTCMRLMLEYAQVRHRYFETSTGVWSRNMVRYWDDLFALCEKWGIRILLTPFDTFWMWLKFKHHPYNQVKGGPLRHPSRALLSRDTREAIKARLSFAAERWGGSGALFAWDLWNEIHPAQAEMSASPFVEFIEELSLHVRAVETRAFGRAHPQTVSLFGPELKLKAHLKMEPAIFRHPSLDFATIHIYEHGTIDDPKNTVDAAVGMGRIVRESLAEIADGRPFFDTEHGPIHSFKDHHKTLPEPFDDEYFRHMQWAHLASGGAGGGMRWPNRHPHSLTAGMRVAQRGLAGFLPCIDWTRFERVNVSEELGVTDPTGVTHRAEACGASWVCHAGPGGGVPVASRYKAQERPAEQGSAAVVTEAKGSGAGARSVSGDAWDTVAGEVLRVSDEADGLQGFRMPPLVGDLALAMVRVG